MMGAVDQREAAGRVKAHMLGRAAELDWFSQNLQIQLGKLNSKDEEAFVQWFLKWNLF